MGAYLIRHWVLLLKLKVLCVILHMLLFHYHKTTGLIGLVADSTCKGPLYGQSSSWMKWPPWRTGPVVCLWETDTGLKSWSADYTNRSLASAPSHVPTTTVLHAFGIKPAHESWGWMEATVNEQDFCQLPASTGILFLFNSLSSQITFVLGIGCNSEVLQETNGNTLRALAPSPLAAEIIHLVLSPPFVHPYTFSQLLQLLI